MIGSESFKFVETFSIQSLQQLKSIEIGSNSFSNDEKQSNSFSIDDCEQLESIKIGPNSFIYSNRLFNLNRIFIHLKFIIELSSLQSLEIGSLSTLSNNFLTTDFQIYSIFIHFIQ